MANTWFVEVAVPALIVTSIVCLVSYALLARMIYDYISRNYGDLLPQRDTWVQGDDIAMGFVTTLSHINRTGGWRRIESAFWRRLYVLNRALGWIGSIALVIFLGGFFV
ncbi:hypothetical protein [Chitinolyticbacter meiyuanensis]|uniref:hypothetical protein n=1 Tax=Chitinolyticbacter meiyuanensis TaxID=682798 RepID=UPI0011E5D47A|nr:hypothetical protein [Chitinolyticbacter meiyuanensis]